MITMLGSPRRCCDGFTRRDFLRVGALAGIGLSLPRFLELNATGAVAPARGKAAIYIRLAGGPSHLDTFDMKPEAPVEIRGEFQQIRTNLVGLNICEHLPQLSRCMDKICLVRSVTHNESGDHVAATQLIEDEMRRVRCEKRAGSRGLGLYARRPAVRTLSTQ